MRGCFFLFFLGLSFQAPAAGVATQISESFASRGHLATATAIWNHATGAVTPTLLVKAWNDGVARNSALDVGDGSLGDFDSTTWANFASSIDLSSKIITIDTNAYPILKFRNFILDAGWTLDLTGSNPLVIDVLGDMTVNGVINCSGKNGSASTGTGAGAGAGIGGTGRCGGAAGGNGGPVYPGSGTSTGQVGSSPAFPTIKGGNPGSTTGAGNGSGGGGGGAWGSATLSIGTSGGNGSGGTGGGAGTQVSNPNWAQYFGSAGGGGGSGSGTEAGGGGGGGGGILILHVGRSLVVGASGLILANGGDGGSSISTGGGGGAGGAGSIQTWVGKSITLSGINPSTISAKSGFPGSPATGGAGGSGWSGRTWTVYPLAAGFFNPSGASIAPPSELPAEGATEYTIGIQTVVSNSYDTSSTLAEFTSASILPASANVSLEAAGSDDQFQTDDTGWVQSVNVAQINKKRFVRFRLSLNNLSGTAPEIVQNIKFNYIAGERGNFQMNANGCGVIQAPQPPGPAAGLLFLPLIFLIWFQCSNPKVKPVDQPIEKLR